VASCILTVIPNLTRGCAPEGLIENVVTHSDFRRRGFGRAILQRALEEAWRDGCYEAMLLIGRLNEGTFRFYESAGFDRHGKQAFIARSERQGAAAEPQVLGSEPEP
jgi:GNAT superfamily N-acetyltransferase